MTQSQKMIYRLRKATMQAMQAQAEIVIKQAHMLPPNVLEEVKGMTESLRSHNRTTAKLIKLADIQDVEL